MCVLNTETQEANRSVELEFEERDGSMERKACTCINFKTRRDISRLMIKDGGSDGGRPTMARREVTVNRV